MLFSEIYCSPRCIWIWEQNDTFGDKRFLSIVAKIVRDAKYSNSGAKRKWNIQIVSIIKVAIL